MSLRRLRSGLASARETAAGVAAPREDAPLSIVAAGVTAAIGVALAGYLAITIFVLVTWALDAASTGTVSDVLATSAAGWLVTHGVTVTTPTAVLGVPPLGLTLLLAWLLARAGRVAAASAGVSSAGQAIRVATALAAAYGVLALVMLAPLAAFDVSAHPVATFLGPYLLSFLAGGVGACRTTRVWPQLRALLPGPVRAAVPGVGIVVGTLLGAGALCLSLSLVLRRDAVSGMLADLDPNLAGLVLVAVLSVLYVPTAVVWTASYVTGAGLTLGAGTVVSPLELAPGPLPSFPLFAAAPTDGPDTLLWILLGVPLAAGILAALRVVRDVPRQDRWWRTAGHRMAAVAVVGAASAVAMGALAVLTGGPLGGDRLTWLGPMPGWLALVVFCEVLAGGAVGLLVGLRGGVSAADPVPDQQEG